MNNIMQEIQIYLSKCEKFTEKEYNAICAIYGKENVSNYFDNAYNNIDKEELDEFLNKYHVYFEDVSKSQDDDLRKVSESDLKSIKSLTNRQLYINSIEGFKLLDSKEEVELFTKLTDLKSKLKIINIINDSEIQIAYNILFMSIKNEKQIKSLIKLYKAKYKQTYENLLSNGDIEIIKKYLKLYEENDMIPSKEEITNCFETVNFTKSIILSEQDFDYQINMLIDFFNIIKKIEYANLRLVLSNAKKYEKKYAKKMEIDDLIQEGNMALRKATLKFDIKKGYKYSTYATWWLIQAMTRAIMNQASLIRKPVHLEERIKDYKAHYGMLMMQLGRNPTIEEMSKEMALPIEKCIEYEKNIIDPVSLDMPIGEDENTSLSEFVSKDISMETESVEEKYERKALKEALNKALTTLTEREEQVLRLRFGLDDGQHKTLEEVGQIFGVTRERIRQIEAKALKKMKSPLRKKYFEDYL